MCVAFFSRRETGAVSEAEGGGGCAGLEQHFPLKMELFTENSIS